MDEPRFIVIGIDGIERGPVTRKDLLRLLYEKVIDPTALLRITTESHWRKLEEIVTLGTIAAEKEPSHPKIPSAGPPPLPEIACDVPEVVSPSQLERVEPAGETSSPNTGPASISEPEGPSMSGSGPSEAPRKPVAYVAAGIIFVLLAIANSIERMMEPKHAGGMAPVLIDGAIGMFLLFGGTKPSSGGILGINNSQSAASFGVFRAWAGIICWPFILAYLSEPKLPAIQFTLNLVGYWTLCAGVLCLLWRNRPEQPGRPWRMAVGIPSVVLGFLIHGAGNSEILREYFAASSTPAATGSAQSGQNTTTGLFDDLIPDQLTRRSVGNLSLESAAELFEVDTPRSRGPRVSKYQCWATKEGKLGIAVAEWDFKQGSYGRPGIALTEYISELQNIFPGQVWTPDGVTYPADFGVASGVAADFVVSGATGGAAQPRPNAMGVNGREASASLFCFGMPSGDPKPRRMALVMVISEAKTIEQQSSEIKRVLNSIWILPG